MIQPSKYPPDQAVGLLTRLRCVWEQGDFALTVQVPAFVTPRPGDAVTLIAAQLGDFDAVLVADAPDGAIALSSMALAVLFLRAGLSPVAQLSGRDKNRLALQSDILGLGALNIPCLLIDTRPLERTSLGRNPDARLVADLDGPALLATAASLRDDARLLSGASVKTPPVFFLGALIDLCHLPPVEQLEPAQFLVTAPVPELRALPQLLRKLQGEYAEFLRSRPLLVSIPLAGATAEESVAQRQTRWQTCLALLRFLQEVSYVRGCNIVIEQLADLELLEQGGHSGLLRPERPGKSPC